MQRIAMLSFHTCPAAFNEGQEIGGMNTYVWELSAALASSGLGIDMFTRRHDKEQPDIVPMSEQVRLIHLPAGPQIPLSIEQMVPYVSEFTQQLMKFTNENRLIYTNFHCHYYLSGLIALTYNQMAKRTIPIIMSFHTLGLAKNQGRTDPKELAGSYRIHAEKTLTQHARSIIANCSLDCKNLQTFYQVPLEKISIISPGVNTSVFKPKKYATHSKTIYLLFVGRTQTIKGLIHLLDALKLLDTQMPGAFTLTIVGSDLEHIKKTTDKLAIVSTINLVEQCGPEALATYYQAADMLILPSYYESFGMVALESIACGTPVIVTQNCGIADMIQTQHKHWVIASNDPVLIARTILDFINNPILMKSNINIYPFTWSNIALQIKRLYGL